MLEKFKDIEPEVKLRFMYLFNICTLLPFGLFMLILPDVFINLFGWPSQDIYIFGIAASVWAIFGFLSIFGYSDPHKYVPILIMQFFYKIVWMLGVFLVRSIISPPGIWSILLAVLMGVYIVGDLLVIPFKEFFKG
ncbi:MAG: hypothetical protein GF317_03690 [Candidatus Lokiarchaeota archaeon]|nr:hypothetical protein [Candidatus Lokiarchaeota archaeon]MBD3198990.1 hypothetical protein [Candidatus Lokiarchaeota archaeon]